MKQEHIVDVGENTRQLLEALASQVGATAEQVFPWYLKAVTTRAWAYLVWEIVVIAVLVTTTWLAWRYSDTWRDSDARNFTRTASVVLTLLSSIVLGLEIAGDISVILAPEQTALDALLKSVKP